MPAAETAEPAAEAQPEAAPAAEEAAEAAPAPQEAAPAPAAPEQPAQEPAAEPAPALTEAELVEENGLSAAQTAQAGFQQMTDATAAEDPLAARYEATTITPDASGRITITPDEFNAMLANQNIDWDEENCLSWLFNWLFNVG